MTTYSSAARLTRLRNRHAGQRCVLVANGPSLNRMDLGFLRGEITIGLNKIHLGLSRFGFSPRYLVAVNPKVLKQAFDAINALPCVKVLGQHAPAAGYREDALTYLVAPGPGGEPFSTDLAKGMHEGWTVTFAALQLAYHLGFAEVVIVGLDHRYQFSGAPNAASVMRGEDPNHFSADYFGGGQTWDNPDLANSENSYRAALAEFNKAGRKIFDATLDGACTVFPKVDYRRHFALAE